MKIVYLSTLLLLCVVGTFTLNAKHGVGCSDTCTQSTLQNLKVSWHYDWNYYTNLTTSLQFVPMCFSGTDKRLTTLPVFSSVLLGFNEPDNSNQANMTVDDAYNKWSTLVNKSGLIASPASAGNPAAAGSWLQKFMAKVPTPKVDYIAVHWYGGIYASSFKTRMQQIYNKFQKPIWITEFACQTHSSSVATPNKFTQAQVNAFLDSVIPWLQSTSYIYRYAWHDSEVGTSAIWYANGTLTETGTKYASFSI